MAKCNNCNVEIISEGENCPLCHNPVSDITGEEKPLFPKRGFVPSDFFFKLDRYFVLVAILCGIISLLLEWFLANSQIRYSYIVFAILLDIFFWLRIKFYIQKYTSAQILTQTILLSIIAASTYFALNNKNIIFEYILPIIYLLAFIAMDIYVFINIKKPKKYLVSLLMLSLLSLLPIVLYHIYNGTFIILAAIVASFGALTIVLILIFDLKRLVWEFRKILHI